MADKMIVRAPSYVLAQNGLDGVVVVQGARSAFWIAVEVPLQIGSWLVSAC